ncbi:hypothetical protein HOP50_18g81730 [Chloropicon primus]|nr:hypothetical protein HOP50_18g81730 [Chloropicon primus]
MKMKMTETRTDYESEREQRVKANRSKLVRLGLSSPSSVLSAVARDVPLGRVESQTKASYAAALFSGPPRRRKPKRRKQRPSGGGAASSMLSPTRLSKRLRGEKPEAVVESKEGKEERRGEEEGASSAGRGRTRAQLVLCKHEIRAPFTLKSIGVTVLDLGKIHRGQWKNKYWSNTGCLFHHAYPVGYKATKWHFNKLYTMWIEAGEYGPTFAVREEETNLVFRGESPTKPWTKVCLHKRLGTRISGPLHFGFSDPTTQAAIAQMYSESELQAALEGSRAWNEEKAAQEFMKIEGVGERTAMVLATTTSLGGTQHRDRDSLAKWAAEDGGAMLKRFLLTSEEMPENVLLWPAWPARFVPRILSHLGCEN